MSLPENPNFIHIKRHNNGRTPSSATPSPRDGPGFFERSTLADVNLTYPPSPGDNNKLYDAEKAQPMLESIPLQPKRPTHSRSSSWDILKKIERGYDQFDARNASEPHLAFAEGDIPKNRVRGRFRLFPDAVIHGRQRLQNSTTTC
jgi:hypothetical protein